MLLFFACLLCVCVVCCVFFLQFQLRPISTSANFWMLNFGTTKGGARRVEPPTQRKWGPEGWRPRSLRPRGWGRRVGARRVGVKGGVAILAQGSSHLSTGCDAVSRPVQEVSFMFPLRCRVMPRRGFPSMVAVVDGSTAAISAMASFTPTSSHPRDQAHNEVPVPKRQIGGSFFSVGSRVSQG